MVIRAFLAQSINSLISKEGTDFGRNLDGFRVRLFRIISDKTFVFSDFKILNFFKNEAYICTPKTTAIA